ncbi:YybH family protein [Flagellimonas pacifica]|uniref:DUF4440 domain-containing protein n=1 Tax=Flagellimonas pacifica TaxID=1247520 RepID=A0A285MUA5_9FLAO|nr:nuclear transport factor 2 family protein [Allomuricauda parva]SNZ00780.1 protein of unknown function [Allomuricauda parva]
MKKIFLLFLGVCLCFFGCDVSEDNERDQILQVLKDQEKSWSNHDLEGFMQTYWESDSLQFYGARGLTLGWEKTLEGYQKRYPTKDETGTLKFTIDAITKIEKEAYYVMGQYHLTRKVGDANGVFLIILKKIKGEWKIVADMSC